MKNLTILEKRLKRAYEYRQSALKQKEVDAASLLISKISGQPAISIYDAKITETPKSKSYIKRLLYIIQLRVQNPRWKQVILNQILFVLASLLIVLMILSSNFE